MMSSVELELFLKLRKDVHRIADALEKQNEILHQNAVDSVKSCENCICDPTRDTDRLIACDHCYDFSEWEGAKTND